MKGLSLRLYSYEKKQHKGILLYEWILEHAKQQQIHGASVLKGIAGYGRHGIMHEEHFFELGNDAPIQIELIVDEKQADAFLMLLKKEGLNLFYTKTLVEQGSTKD